MADSRRIKRVLVAPLDWGLGHATRCIPVIRALRARGCEVIAAGSGPHIDILRDEFPGLPTVGIVNYRMRYAPNAALLALKFPWMVARVFACARREHRELEWIIGSQRIDAVISDQRFGCFSRTIPSVYISHQLCVKMPPGFSPLEKLVWRGLHYAANRFTETWIPDMPGEDSLTGELATKYPLPGSARFVGILSRFSRVNRSIPEKSNQSSPDLLVMLSGPEPQRTMLEHEVVPQLGGLGGTVVVVRGKPGDPVTPSAPSPNVRILNHLPSHQLASLVTTSGAILCRGGYTTLMELVSLGRKAILVPTPGQSEQEYLCRRAAARGHFVCIGQHRLHLASALDRLSQIAGPHPSAGTPLLDEAVEDLLGPGRGR